MLGAFDPSAFDAARPTAFYFEDEDMVDSADAVWVCTGGVELPVHSQVVSVRSMVLREAYRALRENAQVVAPGPVTRKRGRQEPLDRLPFIDCPLKAVAVFLRFLYQPEAVSAANLGSLGDLLPPVARLAHKFSVARVVACAEEWLLRSNQSRTTEQLAMSLDLAETLQLDNLRSNTLLNIAKQLVSPVNAPECPTDALFEVAKLGLGEGDRLRLLAAMSYVLRGIGPRPRVNPQLPALDVMLELGRLQGTAGEFIWDVPGFTLEERYIIESPMFSVGGHEWRLHLEPHNTHEDVEAVSVFLSLSDFQEGGRGVEAAARVTVVSTAGKSASNTTGAHLFTAGSWGFPALVTREQVTNPDNGFLVNDTLRIKAEVVC